MDTAVELSTTDALSRLAECRDPLAWAAILDQHGANILRTAQRITGDEALCDDVCQETLLQIREHAGQFCPPALPENPEAAARGWIMRIACRTAFKMLRTRQRATLRETKITANVSAVPSAAEAALIREESELIRREAAELPELLREPLSLRFYGELSYPELGVALGCSEEAAKKRVQRGLDALRSRLAVNGVVIGAGVLMGILAQGSVQAAESAAVSATVSAATQSLDPQRLAVWQALLKSSSAPALQGVACFGGLTVMAKTVFSAAIVALFAISGYQTLSIHNLQTESAQARAAADQASARASVLEKKLGESKTELAELQSQLTTQQKDAFALRNQVAELKKNPPASPWGNVAFGNGDPQKRMFIAQRKVDGGQEAGNAEVNGINIQIPPDAFQIAVPAPEMQTAALPEATKKALKDAGVNVDDILKNAGNNFEFAKDVDMPGGGKMSVRVSKNGAMVTTATAQGFAEAPPGAKPNPYQKTPAQKPPEPPKTPVHDPNGNF